MSQFCNFFLYQFQSLRSLSKLYQLSMFVAETKRTFFLFVIGGIVANVGFMKRKVTFIDFIWFCESCARDGQVFVLFAACVIVFVYPQEAGIPSFSPAPTINAKLLQITIIDME